MWILDALADSLRVVCRFDCDAQKTLGAHLVNRLEDAVPAFVIIGIHEAGLTRCIAPLRL